MKRTQTRLLIIGFVFTCMLLPLAGMDGVASAQTAQGQISESGAAKSYTIGPRDRLKIQVAELPDLNGEQVVAEDGTISLDVVGIIQASGQTEDGLAFRLQQRLRDEGLKRATVSVKVVEYRSRPVSVLGAVGDPGNHFVPGRANLMEVLLNAGGVKNDHGGLIFVRRWASNGLSDQVQIEVDALLEGGNPYINIPILAGDHINVPAAREVTIHFLGEVTSAGSQTFKSTDRVTLLTALARAGGLLETASKKIRIIRQSGASGREEFEVDYRALLSGNATDPALEDGDLIVVKESFF